MSVGKETTVVTNLVLYIAQMVEELDGSLGVTRLVKLLYLIDVEFYRRYRRKLTDLSWVFYKYGPYAFEIEGHLQSLDLDLTEQDMHLRGGRTFRRLQNTSGAEVGIDAIGGNQARLVIDRTVHEWALEDLNVLLSHVYFETEPMTNPVLGQPLDFNLIPRRIVERQLDTGALQLSDEQARRLKRRLEQFRARRLAERDESLRQRERIGRAADPIYEQARRTMQEDEMVVDLSGANVQVDEP